MGDSYPKERDYEYIKKKQKMFYDPKIATQT
jgi:hypothetical protein